MSRAHEAWFDVQEALYKVLSDKPAYVLVVRPIQHFVDVIVSAKVLGFDINAKPFMRLSQPDHFQTESPLVVMCVNLLSTAEDVSDALTALAVLLEMGASWTVDMHFPRNDTERYLIAHAMVAPGTEPKYRDRAEHYRQNARDLIDSAQAAMDFEGPPTKRQRQRLLRL